MYPVGVVLPRLHVITDEVTQSRFDHETLARAALAGGATAIQLREKRPRLTRPLVDLARRLTVSCRDKKALLVVNDRVDVAMAANAPAVHLGLDDLPLDIARAMAPDLIIGATANSVPEAINACRQARIDYLGVGPVYDTTSKANPAPTIGLDGLATIRKAVDVPLIAIGGITLERVPEVIEAGAHGVAILSGICGAEDPETATRHFLDAVQRAAEGTL